MGTLAKRRILTRRPDHDPLWVADKLYNKLDLVDPFSGTNVTITANAARAPDFTQTAFTFTENGVNGVHRSSGAIAAGTTLKGCEYEFYVYVKQGARRYFNLTLGTGTFAVGCTAYFDLQNGTVVSSGAGLSQAARISAEQPGGFYRLSVRAFATVTGVGTGFFSLSNNGTTTSYLGTNGAVGATLWLGGSHLLPTGLPSVGWTITNTASIATARTQLISDLFAGVLPSEVGTLTPTTSPIDLTGYSACYSIDMVSYAGVVAAWAPTLPYILWIPTTPNGKVMILHQGHSINPTPLPVLNYVPVAQQFLDAGYAVCGLLMPYGSSHSVGPIGDYVGPQVICVNTLAAAPLNYTNIYMYGVSGGGWTTTVLAAVDPRILKSYSGAGWLPLYMDLIGESGSRDYEQYLPGITATYFDMALMASSGTGRRHKQILHYHDPVNANIGSYRTGPPYAEALAAKALTVNGSYQLVYRNSDQHEFAQSDVIDLIFPEI